MSASLEPGRFPVISLMASPTEIADFKAASRDFPSWILTPQQLCDRDLLLTGGFSPLEGFLSREDYDSVCLRTRLASGRVWPIPVTLDIDERTTREHDANLLIHPVVGMTKPGDVDHYTRPHRSVYPPRTAQEHAIRGKLITFLSEEPPGG